MGTLPSLLSPAASAGAQDDLGVRRAAARPSLASPHTPSPPASPSSASSSSSSSGQEGEGERVGPESARWWQRLNPLSLLPPALSLHLMQRAGDLLRAHFVPVLLVYALKDLGCFLLHRASQRATNLGALRIRDQGALSGGQPLLPAVSDQLLGTHVVAASGNAWWLYLDSAFLENNLGYQACIVLFFLLALPLNILLASAAATVVATLAGEAAGLPPAPSGPGSRPGGAAGALGGSGSRDAAEAPKAVLPGLGAGDDLVALAQQQASSKGGSSSSGSSSGSSNGSSSSSKGAEASSSSSRARTAGESSSDPSKQQAGGVAGSMQGGDQDSQSGPGDGVGLLLQLAQGLAAVRGVLPAARARLRRVWLADLLFNAWALPLQASAAARGGGRSGALSLLVVPVMWTVPRLLAIQLTLPVAILEGLGPRQALARSEQLMSRGGGLRPAYGWPFVALLLAMRVLDGLRNVALTAVPPRWWQEVVEVPILLTAAFSFAKLLVIRTQQQTRAALRVMGSAKPKEKPTCGPLLKQGSHKL
ncbi:hypothetical protein QJQ45_015752 [Haematococcus lacustris]|nr:hypothetical protein QJQ45_015752 [Haematococcus lacustris]